MKNKIKVLHLLWSGEIGGTEEYIMTLIKHFDLSKYDIYLCFLSTRGLIYDEAMKLKSVNVTYIGIRNWFDLIGALNFALYLYRIRCDIIHSHMRNFLATAIMILFACRVPKIITHHIGPVDIRIFKKNKIFYKVYARFFRQILAISRLVKDNLIDDFGVKQTDKIEVIHNCVDLDKFAYPGAIPPELSSIQKPDRYVVGFVGRMEYFKRPLLFIEIASELLMKDSKFFFIMVGDGPELEECRNMIHKYKIDQHFCLMGFRRDIPNIMKVFDALLFTSFGEGFGIVLLEAMAMGIPIYAINDGAVPEIIKHEDNGILLNTADPELIAKQILDVMKDTTLTDKISKKCMEDVYSKFTINKCVKQIEKVYERVLTGYTERDAHAN